MTKTWILIGLSCFAAFSLPAQLKADSFQIYEQPVPGSSLHIKMVPVPGGMFTMGTELADKNKGRNIIVSPFWMAAHELSRDAFDIFYTDDRISQNSEVDAVTRPSPQYIDFSMGMGKEGGYPVNSLSQYAALMYCRWLYDKTGVFYRLPTEAEWEYACRAGAEKAYSFNDQQEWRNHAWFISNSDNKFQKSGQKLPNAWGLYDMMGNLCEWTLDHYEEDFLKNIEDKTKDPVAAPGSSRYPKVLKGGSYAYESAELSCGLRIKSDPSWNMRDPQIPKSRWWLTDAPWVGFRMVRPLKQPSTEEVSDFFETYLGL